MTPSERERELQGLYAEYKGLAISVGAGMTLRRDVSAYGRHARDLAARCDAAVATGASGLSPQLDACREAAVRLAELVERADAPDADERLCTARASHRRLRKLVWEVLPCEYVPCSAQGRKHQAPAHAALASERSAR